MIYCLSPSDNANVPDLMSNPIVDETGNMPNINITAMNMLFSFPKCGSLLCCTPGDIKYKSRTTKIKSTNQGLL